MACLEKHQAEAHVCKGIFTHRHGICKLFHGWIIYRRLWKIRQLIIDRRLIVLHKQKSNRIRKEKRRIHTLLVCSAGIIARAFVQKSRPSCTAFLSAVLDVFRTWKKYSCRIQERTSLLINVMRAVYTNRAAKSKAREARMESVAYCYVKMSAGVWCAADTKKKQMCRGSAHVTSPSDQIFADMPRSSLPRSAGHKRVKHHDSLASFVPKCCRMARPIF